MNSAVLVFFFCVLSNLLLAVKPPLNAPPVGWIPQDEKPQVNEENSDCQVQYEALEAVECQSKDGDFVSIFPMKFYLPICQLQMDRRARREINDGSRYVQEACLPKRLRFVNALSWTEEGIWKNVSCGIPYECGMRHVYEPEALRLQTQKLREALNQRSGANTIKTH